MKFLFTADFDWEEQTEKFAEVIGSSRHDDSGFNTAEKAYRSQEVKMAPVYYMPFIMCYSPVQKMPMVRSSQIIVLM